MANAVHSALTDNHAAAERAIREAGGTLIAEWVDKTSDPSGRLCVFDVFVLAGQVILVQRLYEGRKPTTPLQHFEVFRPMGADNKMATLLREIAHYPHAIAKEA